MKNSALVAIGALLIGIVGGYVAGSSGKGGESEEAAAPEGRSSKAVRSGARSLAGGSGEPAPARPAKSEGLREILAEPGQTNRIMSLLKHYAELDPSQFESEMQKLQSLPMSQRMLAMNLLFSRWAETDPQAALEQSRSMGFPEVFMARAGVVTGWAASDPEGLAKQYTENPNEFRMGGPGGRGGGDTVAMIAGEWAKQNPNAALDWARGLEAREAGDAIEGIFNTLAQKDPAEALKMAESLSPEERIGAFRSIAETWAVTDYAAADRWINSLSGEERESARLEAVEALANVDAPKASAEALKLPQGEQREELIAGVSRDWARQDPSAALDYLVTNGNGEAVEDGIGPVIGNLVQQDPAGALAWIDAQPEGQVRDRAVQGYLFGNRDAAPADVIGLAETISDEGERERTVQRVAFQWLRDDREGALRYVESSTVLTDESRERLIEAAADGGDRRFDRGFRP